MIKLYTYSNDNPHWISLQHKSFVKNLGCEFEFIVFNNAKFNYKSSKEVNQNIYDRIHSECNSLNIKCIDIQRDEDCELSLEKKAFSGDCYSTANYAHSYALVYSWKHYISKEDCKIGILDNDMFLIDNENINERLDEYDIFYIPQGSTETINYIWPAVTYLNLTKLPNKEELDWSCGKIDGIAVDVGGYSHYYLKKYADQIKIKNFALCQHISEDLSVDFYPANYEYFTASDATKRSILHYRSGSNWDNKNNEYHTKKNAWLINQLM